MPEMPKVPCTPSFRLDGRRAFVAGASRGIGFALAAALAEAGANLVVASRQVESINEAAQALRDAGFRASPVTLDITDEVAVHRFFAAAERFDVVVNSAGMARHAPSLAAAAADFDQVMAVNCRAAFFLAREAAATMRQSGGSIIQVSSQMGFVGGTDRAVYCASKHAVEGMTKAMAIEWGQFGVRINTICPTFVRTELTAATFAKPEMVAWINSKIKLGRIAEVEDLMGAAVFLASDASAMVTGTHLLVDGGWTAG